MANYLLRSSLNPNKVVKCTITFRQIANKGDDGDPSWLIEIGTVEPHKDGGRIPPTFIHNVTSTNLDEEIEKATELIAAQVDWLPELIDLRPPFVVYKSPANDDNSVSIDSDVIVDIKDIYPAAGIDISSINMTVNGIDVTSDLKVFGDPLDYRVKWEPPDRVRAHY